MPNPRFPWPMGDRSGGPLLGPKTGGGTPTTFFGWNAEIAGDLIDATFTRLRRKPALTTLDSVTTFIQELDFRELAYSRLRRVENLQDDPGLTNYAGSGGAVIDSQFQATFPGSSNSEIVGYTMPGGGLADNQFRGCRVRARVQSGTASLNLRIVSNVTSAVQQIDLTTTFQTFYISAELLPTVTFAIFRIQNDAPGGPFATVVEFEETMVSVTDRIDSPDEYVDPDISYNAGNPLVQSVRIFGTENANTVNPDGTVVENAGVDLAGGGYFPEPDVSNPDEVTTIAGPVDVFTIEAQITMPTVAPAANVYLFGYTNGGYIIRLQPNLQLAISDGSGTFGGGFINLGQRYNLRYSRDLTQRVFQLDSDSPIVDSAPGANAGQWTIGHLLGSDQPIAIFHNISINDAPP